MHSARGKWWQPSTVTLLVLAYFGLLTSGNYIYFVVRIYALIYLLFWIELFKYIYGLLATLNNRKTRITLKQIKYIFNTFGVHLFNIHLTYARAVSIICDKREIKSKVNVRSTPRVIFVYVFRSLLFYNEIFFIAFRIR